MSALLTAAGPGAAAEKLQALDKLTQQMRAIEVFLCAAAMDARGELALSAALDSVLLESVRARLAGESEAPAAQTDVEFW